MMNDAKAMVTACCLEGEEVLFKCMLTPLLARAGSLVVKEVVGGSSAEESAQIEAGDILSQVHFTGDEHTQ